MSEKEKENKLFDKLADESTEEAAVEESVAASEPAAEEKSGEWEFEASAPSLDDDFITADNGGDYQVELEAEPEKEEKEAETKSEEHVNIKISKKAVKITVCTVVAAVVVALLAVFGVRYFTVPNSNEKMNPGNVALKVSKTDVSIGMYNYYYDSIVYEYTYYANYGYYDLDTTADFATQYTTDDDGNEISWLDFFEQQTKERLKLNIYYYEKGVEAGIELTEDQKTDIDEQIANLATTASQSGQSINEYISENYGEYCGEATLRKFLEQYYIAGTYYYQSQILNRPSDEDVQSYFAENEDKYKSVSYAILEMAYDTTDETTMQADIQAAEEIRAGLTDVESMKLAIPQASAQLIEEFISAGYFSTEEETIEALSDSLESTQSKTDVESTFNSEVADWLFSSDTEINATMIYPNSDSGIIYIVMKTAQPELEEVEVYSVRHILIMPDTAEDETEDTAEDETEDTAEDAEETEDAAEDTAADEAAWEDAYAEAQSILEEYNNTDKTELDFAKLAEQYSEDTGSTSAGQSGYYGGGYEGVQLGEMVSEFENWAVDESRRYGDVEIVKSEYGYHIMYFIFHGQQYLYNAQQDCFADAEQVSLDSVEIKEKSGFKKVKVATPDDKAVASASSAQ